MAATRREHSGCRCSARACVCVAEERLLLLLLLLMMLKRSAGRRSTTPLSVLVAGEEEEGGELLSGRHFSMRASVRLAFERC
jgi:hypothetical protein